MLKKPLNTCSPYFWSCALLVCLIAIVPSTNGAVFAQEIHPLAGLWHGRWVTTVPAPNARGRAQENFGLEIKWENNALSGVFNPGRFGLPVKVVTLNSADATVHMEVDIPEGHVVADGKLETNDSGKRMMTGTWTQGVEKGEFQLTRDQ